MDLSNYDSSEYAVEMEHVSKIYKLKTGMSGDYSKNSYLDDMEYNLEQLKELGN